VNKGNSVPTACDAPARDRGPGGAGAVVRSSCFAERYASVLEDYVFEIYRGVDVVSVLQHQPGIAELACVFREVHNGRVMPMLGATTSLSILRLPVLRASSQIACSS
jgi:hypothetical protein